MIINWLVYSIVVGAILSIAGVALDYGARALRLPTRWVWMSVMVLSSAFSALTLAKGFVSAKPPPHREYFVQTAKSAIDGDTVPSDVWFAREEARVQALNATKESPLQPLLDFVLHRTGGLSAPIGVSAQSYRTYNAPLLLVCGALTLIGLITLGVTLARLSGVAYALDDAVVEGVPVLLSRNIGPALLGVTRFRVVLPRWVTEMSPADVRTILTHEQEHALAGDPSLTLLSLLLAALQPWNPAQWFALSRLRLSIELDCDARVLGADGDVRRYGHLLVNVYQRAQSGFSPLTSFVTGTSQLEARVRRMVDAAPKSFSAQTIGAFAVALMLSTTAYSLEVTAPNRVDFNVGPDTVRIEAFNEIDNRSRQQNRIQDSIARVRRVRATPDSTGVAQKKQQTLPTRKPGFGEKYDIRYDPSSALRYRNLVADTVSYLSKFAAPRSVAPVDTVHQPNGSRSHQTAPCTGVKC